jgi:hypothetical protein
MGKKLLDDVIAVKFGEGVDGLFSDDPSKKPPAGTTTISGHSGQSLKLSPEPGLMQTPELDAATGTRSPSHGSPGAVACGGPACPALAKIMTAK